jgi:hypothetical protein
VPGRPPPRGRKIVEGRRIAMRVRRKIRLSTPLGRRGRKKTISLYGIGAGPAR